MIKLSVSDLDSWLAYIEPAQEAFELSTEQLIARLRKEDTPNEEMRIGSAFHSVMETLGVGDLEYREQDGYEFFFEAETTLSIPVLRERLCERVYETSSGSVLLRGKLDAESGNAVTDYKLTFGAFDAERYADSLQWRAYLDMTGAREFHHLVFQANRPGDRGNKIWIHDVHDLVQWAYPGMRADVLKRVGELAEFVRVHVPERTGEPMALPF